MNREKIANFLEELLEINEEPLAPKSKVIIWITKFMLLYIVITSIFCFVVFYHPEWMCWVSDSAADRVMLWHERVVRCVNQQ